MLPKIYFLLFLLIGTLTCNEGVSDDDSYEEEIEVSADGESRRGKLLWSYHPLLELVMKVSGNSFIYKGNGDFFNFIRDSYPLPNGK